jgi:threonine synthase
MSLATHVRCDDCAAEIPLGGPVTVCPSCGGLLEVCYDLDRAPSDLFEQAAGNRAAGMWRWRQLLPLAADIVPVTLGEGDSPLQAAPALGEAIGVPGLLLKNDALMPTGSFKDRGFAVAVSMATQWGLRRGFTYSSGNAGASFAAYAARAGLRATVFVESYANPAKVAAISLYGAAVYRLHYESAADVFATVQALAAAGEHSFVNFINPFRHEAMKTYAYEICESLGWQVPDVMVHPVGTGGGLWGAWKGFAELHRLGRIDRLPRMVGVQPAACAPLVDAFDRGAAETGTIGDVTATMAQSIAGDAMIHGGRRVLRAIRESGGCAVAVTEQQIGDAVRMLGGAAIAAEPSAAAALAGVVAARQSGRISPTETTVAVITGSALKQPAALTSLAPAPAGDVDADPGQWRTVLDVPAVAR